MSVETNARPRLPGRGRARTKATVVSGQGDLTTPCGPTALIVSKRGRGCCVGKITYLGGEPILAIAVRHQQGTTEVVSVPVAAVDLAEHLGYQQFYWRHDREPRQMRRITLANLRDQGWLRPDGEIYLRLDFMERVRWRAWAFAEKTFSLDALINGLEAIRR